MSNFTKLNAWQIKNVYGAGIAGKSMRRVSLKTYANLAERGSNKKSETAYHGTATSTTISSRHSTTTDNPSCQDSGYAETLIAFLPTMSVASNKIKTQPTKGK